MGTYTKKERNFYLLGLAGQNLLYGAVTSCLAYYLQFTILIPAALVGVMIGKAVNLEHQLSGNRPSALFFSVQTFIVKIGTGLSSLVASLAYSLIHFSSAETAALNAFIAGGGVTRLEGSYSLFLWTLFFLYTIPTAVSALLAILPYTDILQKEKRDHNNPYAGGAGKT